MIDLTRPLRSIGRRAIVVMTDRYPPKARGGAELSLHIFVRAMTDLSDVLVLTFDEDITGAETLVVDGVTVLTLPAQAAWPDHGFESSRVGAAGVLGRLRDGALSGGAAAQVSRVWRVGEPEVEALDIARRTPPKGGVLSDFVAYPNGVAVDHVRAVLRHCRPRVIHADNYRSIVLAALASEGMDSKKVGVVRDSRFHCARHSQSVSVNGILCGTCDFACAVEDARDIVETQRLLLATTQDFRSKCLSLMDRVIVTSDYLRSHVAPIVGNDRVMQIPVAPEHQSEISSAIAGVAELPGTNLLIVGMVNENKGQLEVARRLEELALSVPDVVIHLAGRGERVMKAIRKVVDGMGLAERVVEHGFVSREGLYALYRQCQIVLLPTIAPEGFGRVPLEAGACRRPVVAFAAGGLVETILDGVTGYLVPHGDFQALFTRVKDLAGDAKHRHAMGEAAHAHVSGLYDPAELTLRLASVWRELGVSADRAPGGA